jgi:methionyl-tRNA synthetase
MESTRSGKLGEWQRLLVALQVNQTELAHLEPQRSQMAALVSQTEDLFQSQAALAASKQDATQQLASLVSDCQRLATVLRFTLKQFYGPGSEKLVEFGIQPFRGRKKLLPPPPPPAESAGPAVD